MKQYTALNVPKAKLVEWQEILDHLSRLIDIPSALIMRVSDKNIEVCATSESEGNPYNVGDGEPLKGELYCETVIKTQKELLVSNALKDPKWDKNPDIALGMISYCGLPLNWPDNTPFGTICLLDNKENSYNTMQRDLLQLFRKSIEVSLSLIVEQNFLENRVSERTEQLQKANRSLGYIVDKQAATELALKQQKNYDSITDLPNMDQLEMRFNREKNKHCGEFGLIYLRVSNFIQLRDMLGLTQFKRLRVLLTKKIQRLKIHNMCLASLSESEFCFLLLGEKKIFIDQIINAAATLSKNIQRRTTIGYKSFNVDLAIGISVCDSSGKDFMDLLRKASIATSECCNKRSKFEFYESEYQLQLNDRIQMESLMDSALLNDQFHVEYQPFKDIISGEVIGAEALLRWESPILGRISPQQFIGVAEQSGLIHELGYFVLRTAIEQVAYWNSNFNKDFHIAVNLSPIQFKDENLPKKIEELLKFYKVSPKSLEIELTESVFFDDQEKILESLSEMNRLGIDISLDDFGTGFSSLSYLTKFPFSTVKIDSSFIKNVEHSDKSRKLVSAIISMANSLGLSVVAEGIENLEQANFVKEQKADTWQGYYFGKPVKAVDFVQLHFNEVKIAKL